MTANFAKLAPQFGVAPGKFRYPDKCQRALQAGFHIDEMVVNQGLGRKLWSFSSRSQTVSV